MMHPKRNAAALLIGLNYISDSRMHLNGCWNDAIGICSLLTTSAYGFDVHAIDVIIDTRMTDVPRTGKAALVHSLADLSRRSWDDGLETAVISFSGHGSQQRDYDGDEADGMDEGICPSDCMRAGLLLDDELSALLAGFNPATRVFGVFDCCHSGSVIDLPFQFPAGSWEAVDSSCACCPIAAGKLQASIDRLAKGPRIVIMSGCRDEQTSADAYNRTTQKYGGALTMALLDALQKPDGPDLGVVELHARVLSLLQADKHSQYPLISSSHPISDDVRFFQ